MKVGDRFGSLVVLSLEIGAKGRHPVANCRCDCGTVTRHRQSRLRTNKAVRCSECGKKETWANRPRPSHVESAIKRRICGYRDSAKRRGISFDLTNNDCVALLLAPCFYCGAPPSGVAKTRSGNQTPVNGIDRVDNACGYSLGNCVTACAKCNLAKRTQSKQEFF